MKDRIDPLIADRAPWLFDKTIGADTLCSVLNLLLGYDKTLALGEALEHLPALTIMDEMADNLARRVQFEGLDHAPRRGAALIVANHPTAGIRNFGS